MPWKKDSKVQQRFELVQAMMRNEQSVAALCREVGVSRQTAYKFLRRFEGTGRQGLQDKPRATLTAESLQKWRLRVFALRRCWPTWGGAKLLYEAASRAANSGTVASGGGAIPSDKLRCDVAGR